MVEAPIELMATPKAPQEMGYQALSRYISALERSGGVAIGFGDRPWLDSVADHLGEHPWAENSVRPRSTPQARFPTDR